MKTHNKDKIGIPINVSEKNGMWVGDKVSYTALHTWVRKYKPTTNGICEGCKTFNKLLDLANKGIYDRNFENWEWLCRRCHMTKDGRMKNLKQNAVKK
jgi:hypothetical protein